MLNIKYKKTLILMGYMSIFFISYSASKLFTQPEIIDWSLAPQKQLKISILMGKESGSGVQYLEYENLSGYPLTSTYKVQDKYLLEFSENILVPSPVVIPPKKKIRVADYVPIEGIKQTGIGFNRLYTTYANNKRNVAHTPYILPLKNEALVMQAPDKKYFKFWMQKLNSHVGKNINAIDFDVPVGTPVYAMASGKVVLADEASNFGCAKTECVPYANQLEVLHDDGSLAIYSHLKQEGIVVNLGEKVFAGQLIAYSGNTGGGGEPHLHVEVEALQHTDSGDVTITTLPLTFLDERGAQVTISEGVYINENSLLPRGINFVNSLY